MLDPRQWLEPQCSFCGTFTGPFSDVEGLLTMLICIPCLEVRQAQPDTLLAYLEAGTGRLTGESAIIQQAFTAQAGQLP